MSKKNNKDQMLVKLKKGEKEFLKAHGVYGRKCVDYTIRKIKEEYSNDIQSKLEDKIYISEALIEEYYDEIDKEKLLIEKLEEELHELKKNPGLESEGKNKLNNKMWCWTR